MISSSALTNLLYSNNCSVLSMNYDPCCTFKVFNKTYYGSRVLDQFRSRCCGTDCTLDLNDCQNCTEISPLCELGLSHGLQHYMETDIASVDTRLVTTNVPTLAIISISLPIQRMFSGLQFSYETDFEIANISTFASFQVDRVIHKNNNIVVMLNQYLPSGDMVYMSLRNGTYFKISSYVIGNDRFPYRRYLHNN